MILKLPFPVSTNSYWRHTSKGHYISQEGVAFRRNVLAIALGSGIKAPDLRRLAIDVTLIMPDKRKRDIDNFGTKSLLDALTWARIILDDEQIDELTIRRGPVQAPGAAIVTIEGTTNANKNVSHLRGVGPGTGPDE